MSLHERVLIWFKCLAMNAFASSVNIFVFHQSLYIKTRYSIVKMCVAYTYSAILLVYNNSYLCDFYEH